MSTYDIIVVGAGNAALSSAVSAAFSITMTRRAPGVEGHFRADRRAERDGRGLTNPVGENQYE